MKEPMASLVVWPTGVMPVKKHRTAEEAAPTPVTSVRIVSFYHHYASRCEMAARNAPNEKMRAELSKMVHVWREFATEHEQMVRKGRDPKVRRHPSLKGWM
jgi:hypothetical protein